MKQLTNIYAKHFFHPGNIAGAFADGAILFPLMTALALSTEMNGVLLLASAGFAYIFAGFFFHVPMPVQPLKSIVVGAIALGASANEVRMASVGIGLFCLSMALLPVNQFEKYIPRHLIHGIQFSLGVLLILKGVQWIGGEDSAVYLVAMSLFISTVFFMPSRMTAPLLGAIAVLGIVCGMVIGDHTTIVSDKSVISKAGNLRIDILLSLLLPQLALTLTNSVVGTYDTIHRYFGKAALRVTPKNLLTFIGIGNIISAILGGLPFCHGAGGATSHIKAGARHYSMNLYIGFFLVVLAFVSYALKMDLIPHYPVLLMALLVCITGWYHMRLAEESWKTFELRIIILAMGCTVLISQNMLYGLLVGILFEIIPRRLWFGMQS